ncbi:toll/interleukin-1 receptor domain-containing protein [Paenibacillus sp. N3.4]|uniref:toll/interleukin-1 receptor domain-containing protein n=1 Tax=Paenibacillus sp. N3.4 TaxID=2603222 RepID=UPI0011C7153F|nr:hypothetical protein FU659_17735 [Paenibacillus sp. N3.4]
MKIGDSLRQKIDEGLTLSRFGIVVLSPAFFKKQWTGLELNGLLQREVVGRGEKVVLPVWHNLTPREVTDFSPILSDKLAINTNQGINVISKQLAEVISEHEIDEDLTIVKHSYLSLDFSFKSLSAMSTGKLHKYELFLRANLLSPPVLKAFRLCIFWPNNIRISKLEHLRKGVDRKIDNQYYTEYWYDEISPLYPGEQKELIGLDSNAQIGYEFDNDIWSWVNSNSIKLQYKIYYESIMPETGDKNFKDLNEF